MGEKFASIEEVRAGLGSWLGQLSAGLEPGRFRYSLAGSVVPVSGMEALCATCFAMKVAWQARLWDFWSNESCEACKRFIGSFQRPDGLFVDPWLYANTRIGMRDIAGVLWSPWRIRQLLSRKRDNIRAETRQAASTLVMVGSSPEYPMPVEAKTKKELETFFSRLDWSRPWASASHVSHLLFFWSINHRILGVDDDYDYLIDDALARLEDIRDPTTGTWFVGRCSDAEKLNGAMKVLSGLQWADRAYPDCHTLVDFALSQPFRNDSCGFLNRLFVIREGLKGCMTGYRESDVHELARLVLEETNRFRGGDGGYCFFPGRSQTTYYGVNTSKGLSVGDLHGTAMMVWAIALAAEYLPGHAGSPLPFRAHCP